MENQLPQNFDSPPEQKNRSAFTLLALITIAAVLIVSGTFIVLQALKKLPGVPMPWTNPPGGGTQQPGGAVNVPTGIQKFSSYEELSDFLAEHSGGSGDYYYGTTGMMKSREMINVAPPMATDGSSAAGLGATVNQGLQYSTIVGWGEEGDDYSGTNVQVAGVDEADLIKTDGRYLYTVSGNNLFIVDAYPPESGKVLARIAFESTPQNVYINGNALVVFGYNNVIQTKDFYKKFKRHSQYTFFKVFDITDRTNPKAVRELDFEGTYANSRMIGDYVYFLTTNYATYYDGEPPIPRILQNEVELSTTPGTPNCNCPDVYYFDPDDYGYSFTSVAAVNVKNNSEAVTSDVYLLTQGQNIFVSQNNLYITYTKRVNQEILLWEALRSYVLPMLSARDQDKIARIEAVDSSILTRSEKFQKINIILQRFSDSLTSEEQEKLQKDMEEKLKTRWQEIAEQLEKTVIHKIAISGKNLTYKTFGAVPGYVLNQFSMDENNNYFRIATTRSRQWDQYGQGTTQSYSNLYVLDSNLKLVGKVEGLAEGEQIYSVRFMQNRGYMVTFRQTDPLFVIDLSTPTNPTVLGELKIPGVSDYLHPYDDTTLIGIGTESSKLKLSLFDVSDVKNPREISKYLFDSYGSDSIARHEHKAFLFSREKNLLVIPVQTQDRIIIDSYCPPCTSGALCRPCIQPNRYESFQGAAVFSVDRATGFTLRGKIKHGDQLPSSIGANEMRYAPSYDVQIKRSLWIKDVLYTFSDQYVKANRISDLQELKNLKLEKEASNDYQIIR